MSTCFNQKLCNTCHIYMLIYIDNEERSIDMQISNADKIFITPHAYKRFAERIDDTLSKEQMFNIMAEIVRKGTIIYKNRVSSKGLKDYILRYNDIEIVVAINNREVTVVTCLGYSEYANWQRRQSQIKHRAFCM